MRGLPHPSWRDGTMMDALNTQHIGPSTLWGLREYVFNKYLRGYFLPETTKALRKLGKRHKKGAHMVL